jgi:hypothetical protein
MSRVVGCDECAFAFACHEGIAESRLQVMVELAQSGQFVQPGPVGGRPRFAVVPFDPAPVAALHRARRVNPQERRFLCGGRPATQVSDIQYVDTIGDD